uniref:AT09142p n=1 Tax=Drosophila melanogaster TaxID=7227 RepID=Q8T982_DROME|nr:AT09142p [Drosophila melanogaster]
MTISKPLYFPLADKYCQTSRITRRSTQLSSFWKLSIGMTSTTSPFIRFRKSAWQIQNLKLFWVFLWLLTFMMRANIQCKCSCQR